MVLHDPLVERLRAELNGARAQVARLSWALDVASNPAVWNPLLGCHVLRFSYNWPMRRGLLRMAPGECVDFEWVTHLFEAVDPDARHIVTFSGDERDTEYGRAPDGSWCVTATSGMNDGAVDDAIAEPGPGRWELLVDGVDEGVRATLIAAGQIAGHADVESKNTLALAELLKAFILDAVTIFAEDAGDRGEDWPAAAIAEVAAADAAKVLLAEAQEVRAALITTAARLGDPDAQSKSSLALVELLEGCARWSPTSLANDPAVTELLRKIITGEEGPE